MADQGLMTESVRSLEVPSRDAEAGVRLRVADRPENRPLELVRLVRRGSAGASSGAGSAIRPLELVRLVRPADWSKNVFVLVPLLFGGSLTWAGVGLALWAFGCFCLLSSGVYCINDVFDAAADREHPRKCRRPVASGAVPAPAALTLAAVLIALAMLGGSALSPHFLLIATLYLANNLVYSTLLKHREIIDVLLIAFGFVLRILAGCAGLDLRPSSWIIICGFSLAMLLGFGKRRLEIGHGGLAAAYRPSLRSYSEAKLNLLLGITTSICLLSYMLYTVAPETVRLHGTENLIYTVPVVAYGIFRYLFKVQEGSQDGPVEILIRDPVFALTGVVWIAMVFSILFIPLFR
jgi:4-hydroxybenzoate polyprenyltransferase